MALKCIPGSTEENGGLPFQLTRYLYLISGVGVSGKKIKNKDG